MRRTGSSPASPAPLRVRTPGVPKADRSGTGERRSSARQTGGAEAGPAAGPLCKGEGRGKTRPDSSHRPTGRSLIPEKNVAEERRGSSAWPFSLPSLNPSHILSLPISLLPALLPTIIPKQWDGGGGKFFLEADLGI